MQLRTSKGLTFSAFVLIAAMTASTPASAATHSADVGFFSQLISWVLNAINNNDGAPS